MKKYISATIKTITEASGLPFAFKNLSNITERWWLFVLASSVTIWALTENSTDRKNRKLIEVNELQFVVNTLGLTKKKTLKLLNNNLEKQEEKKEENNNDAEFAGVNIGIEEIANPVMPEIISSEELETDSPNDIIEKLKKAIKEHQSYSQEICQAKVLLENKLVAENSLRAEVENNLDLLSHEFQKYKKEAEALLLRTQKKARALEEQIHALETTRNGKSDTRETMWLQMLRQKQDELELLTQAKQHTDEQQRIISIQLQESKQTLLSERINAAKASEYSAAQLERVEQENSILRARVRDFEKMKQNGHAVNGDVNGNHQINNNHHFNNHYSNVQNFPASSLWGETVSDKSS